MKGTRTYLWREDLAAFAFGTARPDFDAVFGFAALLAAALAGFAGLAAGGLAAGADGAAVIAAGFAEAADAS